MSHQRLALARREAIVLAVWLTYGVSGAIFVVMLTDRFLVQPVMDLPGYVERADLFVTLYLVLTSIQILALTLGSLRHTDLATAIGEALLIRDGMAVPDTASKISDGGGGE